MSGEALRDQGLEQAGSGAPVSILVSWSDRARIALMWLCEADAAFSAEDLRRAVGEPPTSACMGAVFRSAVKDGLIEPDGFFQARRPSRHASIERLWRGVRP